MNDRNNFFTNDFVSSSRIIYTPSAFARTSLLYLQETGTLRAIRPHVSSRSNLSSYLLFLVLSGSGYIDYESKRYELQTGDIALMDCRRGYSQSSSEDLWSLKWCHWNGTNMPALYNKIRERGGGPVFHSKDCGVYMDILDSLYATASSESYVRDVLIHEQLTRLVTELMKETVYEDADRPVRLAAGMAAGKPGRMAAENSERMIAENPEKMSAGKAGDGKAGKMAAGTPESMTAGKDESVAAGKGGETAKETHVENSGTRIDVMAVKGYIDSHYAEALSLEGLADMFFVNKNYLARLFKETCGLSVGGYIQLVRIGKAKELLRFSDMSIEQCSYECGYGGDSNYFGRVFKKVEGCSPSAFRRSWRSG